MLGLVFITFFVTSFVDSLQRFSQIPVEEPTRYEGPWSEFSPDTWTDCYVLLSAEGKPIQFSCVGR